MTSDLLCPWCLIATRRMERALSGLGDVACDWVYHPFLVDRRTSAPPPAGEPRAHAGAAGSRPARSKYGNPAPLLRRIEAVARADGIDLDLARVAATLDGGPAHTLLRHARERGSQRALARALFGAHFLECRDVSSAPVLEQLARGHGFAAGEASALLADPVEAQLTRARAQEALDRGVTIAPHVVVTPLALGVPPTGRLVISGAQSVAVFRSAFERSLAPP